MILTQADVVDAVNAGRTWLGYMRRAGPAMTANLYADLSYAAGIPVGNYYASEPLKSAVLNGLDGIKTGPAAASGMKKMLNRVTITPPTATGIMNFIVHDICLYYPFIDGDGGYQDLSNTVSIPRYNGVDCALMAVSQGVGLGNTDVIINYTDSNDLNSTTTTTLNLAANAGTLASSVIGASNYPSHNYISLQTGRSGIKSIQSVEPLSAGGGIFALVIVKPLLGLGMKQSTIAAAIEIDGRAGNSFLSRYFENDSYLSMIAVGTTSASPATILAEFETIWG